MADPQATADHANMIRQHRRGLQEKAARLRSLGNEYLCEANRLEAEADKAKALEEWYD